MGCLVSLNETTRHCRVVLQFRNASGQQSWAIAPDWLPITNWASQQTYFPELKGVVTSPRPSVPAARRAKKIVTRSDLAPRSSGKEDSLKNLKPFVGNPAGNQSRPVELDQQPEASLAWRVGNCPCEA